MKLSFVLAIIVSFSLSFEAFAQEMPSQLKGNMTYPVLDFHPYVGVMLIDNPELQYNPALDYKIAIDLIGRIRDSSAIHRVFVEVARTYNLNIANGVPAEKLQIAAVVHGGMIHALLNDEEYQKKYGQPNPNLVAIKAMVDVGIKFYVCGQNLGFVNLPAENITPMVKMTYSAKTTFVTLDQMGYSYLNVSD